MRQGHPDIAAFHHDLYRAVGRGQWRVLEQQPGAVNWAPHNPAPLPGMLRLWSLEALAHGAQSVNYFRWRQAPFAQEQMHAGLERPDHHPATGLEEARQTHDEFQHLNLHAGSQKAEAAIIFSYDAHWLYEAHPQGKGWNYPELVFEWYVALRRLGLNVDFLSPDMAFDGYKVILAPSLPILGDSLIEKFTNTDALFLFGPRTGSKTKSLTIPQNLAPGQLQTLFPLKVTFSESFPDFHRVDGVFEGAKVAGHAWLDHVETTLDPLVVSDEGGLLYRKDNLFYLTTLPDDAFLETLLNVLMQEAGIECAPLPPDLRLRRNEDVTFLFNYGPNAVETPQHLRPAKGDYLIGDRILPPAGVAAWKAKD